MYDGVCVVGFTCTIGKRVLHGVVKNKEKARQVFDAAVARGETAGLLVQEPAAADVFSTELGNIPAGEKIIAEITYIGELKDDDIDGLRFTIPTSIAPRYGADPVNLHVNPYRPMPSIAPVDPRQLPGGQIKITVDINLPDGLAVKSIQSPSHPIAVAMGTLSTATEADPATNKASATLSLGSAALEKDFVLIVHSKRSGVPKALLETHSTIPNHRALMATLVPRFSLPPTYESEIVFVADRSGSMISNIPMLISAMKVFLKSMPTGVKFNICSFGSDYQFHWKKSQLYSSKAVSDAAEHILTFQANFGGTETFKAIKATVDNRLGDCPLEIIVLTDGDIWSQGELFDYVNAAVKESDGGIRIFPLGIGNGVSHSLIGGLARAGNGFAQTVQEGERLDNSVVRMLRGALSPHITDYALEVKYDDADDDFEVVDGAADESKNLLKTAESGAKMLNAASEPVQSGMKVLSSDMELIKSKQAARQEDKAEVDTLPATISLWDPKVEPEPVVVTTQNEVLPVVLTPQHPKVIQAPHKIPSLVPFSRTTVYLLMGPETIHRNPTSVTLHATCGKTPLTLEIPIEVLPERDQTIHQLAARKASQDLEESRGWVFDSKKAEDSVDYNATLAEKEAIRLGETFQVANKWCSFVAVSRTGDDESMESYPRAEAPSFTPADQRVQLKGSTAGGKQRHFRIPYSTTSNEEYIGFAPGLFPSPSSPISALPPANAGGFPPPPEMFRMSSKSSSIFGIGSESNQGIRSSSLFGAARSMDPSPAQLPQKPAGFSPPAPSSQPPHLEQLFGQLRTGDFTEDHVQLDSFKAVRSMPPPLPLPPMPVNTMPVNTDFAATHSGGNDSIVAKALRAVRPGEQARKRKLSRPLPTSPTANAEATIPETDADKVLAIIDLQDFDGSWAPGEEKLSALLEITIPATPEGTDKKVWITMVVIKFLELKMTDEEGMWLMVVEKARAYVQTAMHDGHEDLEKKAEEAIKQN